MYCTNIYTYEYGAVDYCNVLYRDNKNLRINNTSSFVQKKGLNIFKKITSRMRYVQKLRSISYNILYISILDKIYKQVSAKVCGTHTHAQTTARPAVGVHSNTYIFICMLYIRDCMVYV